MSAEDERNCNTCHHYDPEKGVCKKTGEPMHGYDGDETSEGCSTGWPPR